MRRARGRFGAGLRGVALCSALVGSGVAHAQWRVSEEAPSELEDQVEVAQVVNNEADAMRVFLDADGLVRAKFTLGAALDKLDARTCPTYLIDDERPQVTAFDAARCRMEPGAVTFTLGRVVGDTVASESLLGLMKGTELRVRFHVEGTGYRQSRFSLRGSKQALNAAIGRGVRVVGERVAGERVAGERVGGEPVGDERFGGEPVGAEQLGGEQVGGEPVGAERFGGEQVGGEPVGAEPLGGEQVGGEPVGAEQLGGEQVGGEPVGAERFGGEQVGGEPVGAEPLGGEGAGDEPVGDERFGGE
jgi:hypothetical protein